MRVDPRPAIHIVNDIAMSDGPHRTKHSEPRPKPRAVGGIVDMDGPRITPRLRLVTLLAAAASVLAAWPISFAVRGSGAGSRDVPAADVVAPVARLQTAPVP